MIRLRNITVVLVALCALAVAAPPAFAKDGNWRHVISECYNTGDLTHGRYTRRALRIARHRIPSDIREYSDCLDLINNALAASHKPSGGGGGGGGGAGAPGGSTPSGAVGDQRDIDASNLLDLLRGERMAQVSQVHDAEGLKLEQEGSPFDGAYHAILVDGDIGDGYLAHLGPDAIPFGSVGGQAAQDEWIPLGQLHIVVIGMLPANGHRMGGEARGRVHPRR